MGGRHYHRMDGDEEAGIKKTEMNTSKTVSLLRAYFWPEGCNNKFFAMLSVLLLICAKASNIVGPLFIGRASNHLLEGWVDWPSIVYYGSALALSTIFKELQNLVYLKVQQHAYIELAAKTFAHLHSLSLNWHLTKKTGSAMRAMDRGINSANTVVKYLFMNLVPTVVEAGIVCVIFYLHFDSKWLAAIASTGMTLYCLITYKVTRWRKKIRTRMNKRDDDAHDKAVDSLVNFETVKYFTNEDFELKRYQTSLEQYQTASVQTQGSLNLLNSMQSLIINGTLVSSLIVAGYNILNENNTMKKGDFLTVAIYINQLFSPLSFLGTIYNMVIQAFVDMQKLYELLESNPDVADMPNALEFKPQNPGGPVVEFKDVYFHYPEQPPANGLRGISFQIKAGTTTAIVGHSGAGKSTISRLLFRFYDIKSGSITIDGQRVEHLKQKSLRSMIGIVPQDTVLFNDTMMYNIQYGDTTKTEEDVVEASKVAQIKRFIDSLDAGLMTVVGERGLKLSGGEKQRVAIARTLLKNPPLLILDEATSSLDSVTEEQIQEELDQICQGRTTIIIAHRLSTIVDADQILVLDRGTIVERGTHAELLERRGDYYELWNKQTHGGDAESKDAE